VLASALVVPLVMASCSESKLAGVGADCLQATDCEEGLVCIPSGGRRICSGDLSGIEKPPEKDASTSDGNQTDASRDGAVPDANKPDTNVPDTNVPDTRPPADTGADAP